MDLTKLTKEKTDKNFATAKEFVAKIRAEHPKQFVTLSLIGITTNVLNMASLLGMLEKRLQGLEARVAESERKGLDYRGVWSPTVTDYQRGDAVTCGGSLWVCREATETRPGESPYWQLAVKRGSRGKPA